MADDKGKEPIIPDYGREQKPPPKGSVRRILSDMRREFFSEFLAQLVIPGIVCFVVFVLWTKGCAGSR
jgi:hypothetical protein